MKKLILGLAAAGLAAGTPALARPYGGGVAKIDTRAVLVPDGYAVRQYSRDDGFFSYRGGGVGSRYGRPTFEYDRSYPYDYVAASEEGYEDEPAEPRERSCEDAPARSGAGRAASVRICRN